ncbi:hypothetical protein PoB_006747500 [Plakobranchus ocellatus]|uniref:Uncharacterized protein n=1 Tax=Plakobranchus ocellatus TaxID=259542 RepID=A0AAV4DAA6_9GAST|nr:hypothetical protein PoB_006747500 [Plakobranchus ocellatus]
MLRTFVAKVNMSGVLKGILAWISSLNKKALYFHCVSQHLNLCIVKSGEKQAHYNDQPGRLLQLCTKEAEEAEGEAINKCERLMSRLRTLKMYLAEQFNSSTLMQVLHQHYHVNIMDAVNTFARRFKTRCMVLLPKTLLNEENV